MATTTLIHVTHDNLVDINEVKFDEGIDVKKVKEVVVAPAMKVDLDVILPEGSDTRVAANSAKKFLEDFQKRLQPFIKEGLTNVMHQYQKDTEGDKQAYSTAESILNKLSKHLERHADEFRTQLRDAVAKSLGKDVKGKDLQTIGRSKFKEFYLALGAFKGEVNLEGGDSDELIAKLKKKNWQYFGFAWHGKEGKLEISGKKEMKKEQLKELKTAVGNGAKAVVGMLQAAGKDKITAEILKSAKHKPGAANGSQILRETLKNQANAGHAAELVEVDEYTAEKKAPASGKTKEKEKT